MTKKNLCIILILISTLVHAENRHPRLFMNDDMFASLKENVASSAPLAKLHEDILSYTDEILEDVNEISYTLDKSHKRFSGTPVKGMEVLSLCTYAYRFTGDKKYLEKAEQMLLGFCSLQDWNVARHTLNTAEIGTFVALGYDWLYHHLSPDTRSIVEEKIVEYFLKPIDKGIWSLDYQKKDHNWNQVCNSGVISASLVLDTHKELTERLIKKAVETNSRAVSKMYSAEGNYPEGPGYWAYGTVYQTLLIDALYSCLGHDFGISDIESFSKTGEYRLAASAPGGKVFNYSDNGAADLPDATMWFFADRYKNPAYIYKELQFLKEGNYLKLMFRRKFLPMLMIHAANIDLEAAERPSRKMYVGRGENPVVMIHTDWTLSESDEFLGIKGGHAKYNHGHMDAGSFVFDAEGVRWAADLSQQTYESLENTLKALKGKLFNMNQQSVRWKIFKYNNRQHNTLTINDTDHRVEGKAYITDIIDTDSHKGAVLDMTEVFGNEAAKVERTVELIRERGLVVTDIVKAQEGKDARIRWTMVSMSTPTITRKGIRLENDGKTRYLRVKGKDVEYRIFEADPKNLDDIPLLRQQETYEEGTCIVGFTATVPAGKEREFVAKVSR